MTKRKEIPTEIFSNNSDFIAKKIGIKMRGIAKNFHVK
jgi:hypothetical protein